MRLKDAKERNSWIDEIAGYESNLDAFNYLAREKSYFDIVRLFGSYWNLSMYLVHYYNEIMGLERHVNSMRMEGNDYCRV